MVAFHLLSSFLDSKRPGSIKGGVVCLKEYEVQFEKHAGTFWVVNVHHQDCTSRRLSAIGERDDMGRIGGVLYIW